MHRGYIKLWRRMRDSEMWLKEKFTRGQAWVDLIMLANYKEGYIRKRGVRVDLCRGDVGWSERELADRWKWSRNKVRRFLLELCSENESKLIPQTIPQKKNVTSCYHIRNYDTYQDARNENDTTNDTTKEPQKSHKRYQKKNDKNDKKGKEELTYPPWLDLDVWQEYKKHRKNGKSKFTPYAEKLAIGKLKKFKSDGDDPNEVINQSILHGWSGLFPLKKDHKKEETPDEWLKRVSQKR